MTNNIVQFRRFVVILATIILVGSIVNVNIPSASANPDLQGSNPSVTIGPNEFINPSNAFLSDDVYATGVQNDDQGYLFSFTIPSGSIINGIEVKVEGNRGTCAKNTKEFEVKLSQTGGSNFSGQTKGTGNLGDADSIVVLGGPEDLWGLQWMPTQITTFALRVTAKCTGGPAATGPLNLDFVTATVHYTPTVETATGTGIAILTSDTGGLTTLDGISEPNIPPAKGKPRLLNFQHGFFDFQISGFSPGATVTVTVTFPAPVPEGSQYWKIEGDVWIKLPDELVGDNDGDNILTLTLTDGGIGDTDGEPNGIIVDPGGIGIPPKHSTCEGRTIVTNDPTFTKQCVILDLVPPTITKAFVTSNDFLCVEAIDDTGIVRVSANGIEVPRWSGNNGSFCGKGIVKLGDTISISATDFAGNKAGAVVLASVKDTQTSQAFASYVDKEYNPHEKVEAIIIENLSKEPLKQVRLMLSPDMDRGKFLLSDYAFKQIDDTVKVTIRMNTNNTKEFQGDLIVAASNSGIISIFPVDVKSSDFKIRESVGQKKHSTIYLEKIDADKLTPSKMLNSLQKAELDNALQNTIEGISLTPSHYRILQYATIPDSHKLKHNTHDYDVWVNDGEQAIKSLQGSVTIKNTSDRSMNNIRIKVELPSRILMFEEQVIGKIASGEQVTVNFKPLNPETKIIEQDYMGVVIIAPSDHRPVTIPIVIKQY